MTELTVQPAILAENFLDSTYVNAAANYSAVVLSGGLWQSARPLTNLRSPFLFKTARTTSTDASNAFLHIDFGVNRDVSGIAITPHNLSLDGTGKIRIRASSTINWSGVTVSGVNSSGATTLSVSTTNEVTVKKGDGFTIENDDQVYQATADVTIAASSTGNIGLTRVGSDTTGLAASTVGGETVTCHAGDYDSATVLDTGFEDVSRVIHEYGSLPFGHPSWPNGRPSPEEQALQDIPYVKFPGLYVARYWRVDFQDTNNADGYIDVGRMIFARSIEPTLGMAYGSALGLFTDSTVKKSKGGARIVNEQAVGRTFAMILKDLPEREAMSLYSTLKKVGLGNQVFMAFSKNDSIHLHRRAFLATIQKIDNPMSFSNFSVNDTTINFIEVLA